MWTSVIKRFTQLLEHKQNVLQEIVAILYTLKERYPDDEDIQRVISVALDGIYLDLD